MGSFLSFLSAIPAITKLLALLVEKFLEAEKKQQKTLFRESVKSAILKGDQRAIEDSAGAPSGHQGVKVVKRDEK